MRTLNWQSYCQLTKITVSSLLLHRLFKHCNNLLRKIHKINYIETASACNSPKRLKLQSFCRIKSGIDRSPLAAWTICRKNRVLCFQMCCLFDPFWATHVRLNLFQHTPLTSSLGKLSEKGCLYVAPWKSCPSNLQARQSSRPTYVNKQPSICIPRLGPGLKQRPVINITLALKGQTATPFYSGNCFLTTTSFHLCTSYSDLKEPKNAGSTCNYSEGGKCILWALDCLALMTNFSCKMPSGQPSHPHPLLSPYLQIFACMRLYLTPNACAWEPCLLELTLKGREFRIMALKFSI